MAAEWRREVEAGVKAAWDELADDSLNYGRRGTPVVLRELIALGIKMGLEAAREECENAVAHTWDECVRRVLALDPTSILKGPQGG